MNQQLLWCFSLAWALSTVNRLNMGATYTHTQTVISSFTHHIFTHVFQTHASRVVLTSTMESTSRLPYQSGSYMSAKHACTFFEDSCMADDKYTYFMLVEHPIFKSEHIYSMQMCVSCCVYTSVNLYQLVCVCATFHCFQVGPEVPLQFAAFSLRVEHKQCERNTDGKMLLWL